MSKKEHNDARRSYNSGEHRGFTSTRRPDRDAKPPGVWKRVLLPVLIGIGIAGAAIFYFTYNPEQSNFFPRCLFLEATGYKCPGCGSQRALHHLLHGRIGGAWSMNPLLVILIPYMILGAIVELFYRAHARKYAWAEWMRKNLYGAVAAWTILAVVVLYTVLRNIYHF